MRSEQELYDLILGYARQDERIRAVVLNGSRANPAARRDPFQDFDIVYLATEVEPYKEGDISGAFGEILVMSRTDEVELFDEHFPEFAAYLMLFQDGNRIDLTVARVEDYHGYCFDDRLSVVLLDKDSFLPELPPPDDSSHYIAKPNERVFRECWTEFWWTSPYVSKALWRGQLLYAQTHMESCVRKMLLQMMTWLAGAEQGFAVSAGKCGDELKRYLPARIWEGYLHTFALCEEDSIWDALLAACGLFPEVTALAAEKLGFSYDAEIGKNVTEFIRYTRSLPRDAAAIEFDLKGSRSHD